MKRTATVKRAQEGAISKTGFWEKVELQQEDEHRAKAEQRASSYHGQAAPGIGFRYVEELTDDRSDEDAERNRGEDIARELQRIKRGRDTVGRSGRDKASRTAARTSQERWESAEQ